MAALQILLGDRIARGLARQRIFRDRRYPLEIYDDVDMYERYRFTRRGVMKLLDILEPHLQPPTMRSHAIDYRIQVFTALKFYATGTVHNNHGDHHGISKASASRIVRRVTKCLVRLKDDHVKFPTTPQEVAVAQGGFFAVAGFPRVVSAVDCTHVLMYKSKLGPNAHVYVNRKRAKSINVQLMCDSRYRITNVVARWPGSTHDSRILQHSDIGQRFAAGQMEGIIIGDGGYPLRPWLMVPIPEPDSHAERNYNR